MAIRGLIDFVVSVRVFEGSKNPPFFMHSGALEGSQPTRQRPLSDLHIDYTESPTSAGPRTASLSESQRGTSLGRASANRCPTPSVWPVIVGG